MKAKCAILSNFGPNTPPPRKHLEAMLYPDTKQWMQAIDVLLDKLDKRDAVQWLPVGTTSTFRPILFTLNFEYNRNTDGKLIERKARFALRGDMMEPDIHFDPPKISVPMADKAAVRLLISIVAQKRWKMEHMGMKSSYIHTIVTYMFKLFNAVYVKDPPRANVLYQHDKAIVKLIKNIYGGRLGAFYFLKEVFSLLK